MKTGILILGMVVIFAPTSITAEVKFVKMHYEALSKGLPRAPSVSSMYLSKISIVTMCLLTEKMTQQWKWLASLPRWSCWTIQAKSMLAMNLQDGYATQINCKFAELKEGWLPFWKETIRWPKFWRPADAATIETVSGKPTWVDSFSDDLPPGCCAVHNMRWVVAVAVLRIVEKELLELSKSPCLPRKLRMNIICDICHPNLHLY